MNVVCLLLVSLAVVCLDAKPTFDAQLNDLWDVYKVTHKKKYNSTEEEHIRRTAWEYNIAFIQKHNLKHDLAKVNFTAGINEYSDWFPSEYRLYLNGARPPPKRATRGKLFSAADAKVRSLPKNVDWRQEGYVTPIKNQGQCGSCWAFSSTGALEGQHFRATGQLVSLSEQNLVDCTTKYGNSGCNGGWMDNAFYYVEANEGLDTESCYPYYAKDRQCDYRSRCSGTTDLGYLDIEKDSEEALAAAVAAFGPISVAIDATHESFMQYRSGVYYEPACSAKQTDHAVLVVGYGTEDGQDYWLVKNSWGTSWGMDGYIKMARNRDNNCAIATYASVPQVLS